MTNRHSSRLARIERAVAPPADEGVTIIWGTGPDARISRGPRPQGSPIVLWGYPPPKDANSSPEQ